MLFQEGTVILLFYIIIRGKIKRHFNFVLEINTQKILKKKRASERFYVF